MYRFKKIIFVDIEVLFVVVQTVHLPHLLVIFLRSWWATPLPAAGGGSELTVAVSRGRKRKNVFRSYFSGVVSILFTLVALLVILSGFFRRLL